MNSIPLSLSPPYLIPNQDLRLHINFGSHYAIFVLNYPPFFGIFVKGKTKSFLKHSVGKEEDSGMTAFDWTPDLNFLFLSVAHSLLAPQTSPWPLYIFPKPCFGQLLNLILALFTVLSVQTTFYSCPKQFSPGNQFFLRHPWVNFRFDICQI